MGHARYAINAIGRSKPISTAYTVAEPLEKTFFYPLSTDPSIPKDPIPDAVVADISSGHLEVEEILAWI